MQECQSNQSFTIGRWFYPKRHLLHLKCVFFSFYAFQRNWTPWPCAMLYRSNYRNMMCQNAIRRRVFMRMWKGNTFCVHDTQSVSGTGSMSTAGAHGRYDYSEREQWECERCNKGYVGTRAQVLYSNLSLAMSSLSSVRSHTLSMTMMLQQRKIHPIRMVKVVFHCFIWCIMLFTFQSESLKCFLSQRYPTSMRLLFFDLILTFHYYIASALSILSPCALCLWLTFILPLFRTVQKRS